MTGITRARLGVVAVLLTAAVPMPAFACSCLPASLAQIFADADAVARVRIVGQRQISPTASGKMPAFSRQFSGRTGSAGAPESPAQLESSRIYVARVLESFKGCLRRGSLIRLSTASNDGLCGVTLTRRTDYLVTARSTVGSPSLFIHSCGYNVPFASLRASERSFLDMQPRCCGDDSCECSAAAPKVYCFADPCRLTQCADGGSCTASYCGGCNASFRDASGHVLCSPCEDDRDCSYGQACVDGRCRSSDGGQAACEGDADCAADEFCRFADQMSGRACAAYSQLGETCGGFVPPSAEHRCAPPLVCIPDRQSEIIADLPGTCG